MNVPATMPSSTTVLPMLDLSALLDVASVKTISASQTQDVRRVAAALETAA